MTIINPNQSAAQYVKSVIRQEQIDKYLKNGKDFIDDKLLKSELASAKAPDAAQVRDIIAKSLSMQTLTTAETATLLKVDDPGLLTEMGEAGLKAKKFVYDNRIVTFAPLYLSNLCVNGCLYCGFRAENKHEVRRKLNMDEVPCILADDLTPAQIRAFRIADNKTSDFADWDFGKLDIELEELKEMDFDYGFGFDIPDFIPGTIDEQGKLDELSPKIVICPHCGKEFDVREQE